jgi:hypothetical protein
VERQKNRNYSRIPIISDLTDMLSGGGGQPDMQTTTQQNLPSWAIPDAMSTLGMGNYYTQNPDYRASTLDRDYSGIRGGASGVGQVGLNPRRQALPALPGANLDGTMPYRPDDINNLVSVLPPDLQTGGPLLRRPVQNMGPDSFRRGRTAASEDEGSWWDSITDFFTPDPEPQTYSAPTTGPMATPGGDVNNTMPGGSSSSGDYPSTNYPEINTDADGQFVSGPGNTDPDETPVQNGSNTDKPDDIPTTSISPEGETTDPTIDPRDIFNPDDLTPFQAFDRQRFAGPSEGTLRGEGILSGRYDQRFGEGGTDPFAAANQAVGSAANYQSGFQGTMGGLGGQAGNYQAGLGSATNPNVFQSGNYTSGLPNFANPNAGMRNVNQGLQARQFGNANQSLQGPVNYQQERSLRDSMQQFQDPYTDRVVNQTIRDMDRARQMTANQISGDAAKAGAFGGSRSMLMQAENNRNFADRTAAAVGQLRSQGFQRAADLAQQENLQRLGLSASDLQNVRGLTSQGNLQGQRITADDLQNVRGLTSQGGLAAQGLQSQGALAALGANAGLYQSALGLNAAGDRSAMGYNAGLLGDAMRLDASDLNQRRNIASNESQFAETANRGAGALNLQGGTALGNLAQAGTADERQRIADMLAGGGAQTGRDQQDLDFIYGEFDRELGFPGQQIDLRNAAISPATGSVVTTTQPRYQQNPILGGFGGALTTYGITQNPYLAGAAGLLGYLNS